MFAFRGALALDPHPDLGQAVLARLVLSTAIANPPSHPQITVTVRSEPARPRLCCLLRPP